MYFYATNMQFFVLMKLVFCALKLHSVSWVSLSLVQKWLANGPFRDICAKKSGGGNMLSDLSDFISNIRRLIIDFGRPISNIRSIITG